MIVAFFPYASVVGLALSPATRKLSCRQSRDFVGLEIWVVYSSSRFLDTMIPHSFLDKILTKNVPTI